MQAPPVAAGVSVHVRELEGGGGAPFRSNELDRGCAIEIALQMSMRTASIPAMETGHRRSRRGSNPRRSIRGAQTVPVPAHSGMRRWTRNTRFKYGSARDGLPD
jgi:hypothetical protein